MARKQLTPANRIIRDLLAVLVIGTVLVPVSRWAVLPEGQWPERPIELVVFSAAGGGTDAANRVLAAAMEEELGMGIRVSNMTGGRGGAAAQYVYGRAHDGYRWMGVSETILSLATRGGHFTTSEHWHHFVFAGSPGVISVPLESPYQTFAQLIDAVREHPGRLTIAASGRGSIWHLRTEILRRQSGFDVRFIPYDGSGPSQVAALSGEVDMVHTALAEQMALVQGRRLRPLVAVEPEGIEVEGVGWVPAITEFAPELDQHLPLPQWLGFQVPSDTPEEIVAVITAVYHGSLSSTRVQDFLTHTHHRLYGLSGEEAAAMVKRQESVLNWMMHDLGLVEISPDKVGIPEPLTQGNAMDSAANSGADDASSDLRKSDVASGLLLVMLGAAAALGGLRMPGGARTGLLVESLTCPGALPMLLGVLLMGGGAAVAWNGWRTAGAPQWEDMLRLGRSLHSPVVARGMWLSGTFGAYLLLLRAQWLPYWIATYLYLAVVMVLLRASRIWVMIGIALAVSAGLQMLFGVVLRLPLP